MTVRSILNKYVEMVNPTWLKGVPEMIEFYNNRYHRSIQGAPFEMTRETVMFNSYTSATSERAEAYQKKLEIFKPGTRVRVYESENPDVPYKQSKKEDTFRKASQRWTKKIFTVQGLSGRKVLLVGYDKRYSPRDLQITKQNEEPEVKVQVNIPEQERERKHAKKVIQKVNEVAPFNPELLDTKGVQTRSQRKINDKPVESEQVYEVKKVLSHKKKGKSWTFLIKWADNSETLEPIKHLILGGVPNEHLLHYLDAHPELKIKL